MRSPAVRHVHTHTGHTHTYTHRTVEAKVARLAPTTSTLAKQDFRVVLNSRSASHERYSSRRWHVLRELQERNRGSQSTVPSTAGMDSNSPSATVVIVTATRHSYSPPYNSYTNTSTTLPRGPWTISFTRTNTCFRSEMGYRESMALLGSGNGEFGLTFYSPALGMIFPISQDGAR